MIYTDDNRRLLTVKELASLFECSKCSINLALDRFNTQRIKYKDKMTYIEFNDDFINKFRAFTELRQNKKSYKILEIIKSLQPLNV